MSAPISVNIWRNDSHKNACCKQYMHKCNPWSTLRTINIFCSFRSACCILVRTKSTPDYVKQNVYLQIMLQKCNDNIKMIKRIVQLSLYYFHYSKIGQYNARSRIITHCFIHSRIDFHLRRHTFCLVNNWNRHFNISLVY